MRRKIITAKKYQKNRPHQIVRLDFWSDALKLSSHRMRVSGVKVIARDVVGSHGPKKSSIVKTKSVLTILALFAILTILVFLDFGLFSWQVFKGLTVSVITNYTIWSNVLNNYFILVDWTDIWSHSFPIWYGFLYFTGRLLLTINRIESLIKNNVWMYFTLMLGFLKIVPHIINSRPVKRNFILETSLKINSAADSNNRNWWL